MCSIPIGMGSLGIPNFFKPNLNYSEPPIEAPVPKMSTRNQTGAQGLADPVLLDKIDRLFSCNVGQYIPLPQLVVVGDQSSGKSSILEGLTGIPFPRDSGLCTRFATHITFRRSPTTSINISITPARDATAEHIEELGKLKYDDLKDLDSQTFSEIMAEAGEYIGIEKTTFSRDVLRLDLSGPTREQLSVIDVPGIFRKTTQGLTTEADIALVRNMVTGYMENPRSVMLIVVPANVDIATQEIVDLSKKYDPEGIRTLGVLTKPDLVDKGAEHSIIDILEGKREQLSLGWHVVRNLGQGQLLDDSVDRLSSETAFFMGQQPWSSLDKDVVGVESLQKRLKDILTEHVRREFPGVRSELNKKLSERKGQLESLGKSRGSSTEQRLYLIEIATTYQELANQTLSTGCSIKDESDSEVEPKLRLATIFIERSQKFAKDMRQFGHSYEFNKREMEPVPQSPAEELVDDDDDDDSDDNDDDGNTIPEGGYNAQARKESTPSDLQDILKECETIKGTNDEDIFGLLREIYRTSRGLEMGTFSASILPSAMKLQSRKWQPLVMGYVEDILCIIHRFSMDLLDDVCADERVRTAIKGELIPRMTEIYKQALEHARFLLHMERNEMPYTANPEFDTNLAQGRWERLSSSKAFNALQNIADQGKYVRKCLGDEDVFSITKKFQKVTLPNEGNTILDIRDVLKAYYSIALERTIDGICKQAAGHFLVIGSETPLKIFSPSFVAKLQEDQLKYIAGEEPMVLQKRKRLESEISDLENGKKILF